MIASKIQVDYRRKDIKGTNITITVYKNTPHTAEHPQRSKRDRTKNYNRNSNVTSNTSNTGDENGSF